MAYAVTINSRQDKNKIRFMCQRGPNLLPRYLPLMAAGVKFGPCSNGSKIRTRAGFGIPLTPESLSTSNVREVSGLLVFATKSQQRGSRKGVSDVSHASRSARACILLMIDDLLLNRGASTAPRFRPSDTRPASFGEATLPSLTFIHKAMLVTRATSMPNLCELIPQVLIKPLRNFLSKQLIGGCERQLHVATPSNSWQAIASRISGGRPR